MGFEPAHDLGDLQTISFNTERINETDVKKELSELSKLQLAARPLVIHYISCIMLQRERERECVCERESNRESLCL